MSRPPRSERMANKGRPKRLAARTHFFKYQLANNPTRAADCDLKKALQESLKEHSVCEPKNISSNGINLISSTNSSDFTKSNNSSYSNPSSGSNLSASSSKRTRSSSSNNATNATSNKRARIISNGSHKDTPSVSVTHTLQLELPTSIPHINKAIKTYSRSHIETSTLNQKGSALEGPRSSTPIKRIETLNAKDGSSTVSRKCSSSVSKSTQTSSASSKTTTDGQINNNLNSKSTTVQNLTPAPVQDQAFKFKRESKNYAYVKMTALKVSNSKSPSNSKSSSAKKKQSNGIQIDSTKKPSGKDSSSQTTMNLSHVNNVHPDVCSIKQVSKGESMTDHGSRLENIKTSHNGQQNINSNKTSTHTSALTKASIHNGKATAEIIKLPKAASKNVQITQTGKSDNLKQNSTFHVSSPSPTNDCSIIDNVTIDLSPKTNQNHANVNLFKRRSPQGSWSLLGVPEEKVIYLRDDDPPRRLICYPAIKHIEGDVIQVRDSVLLRSGARKTDLPYIAKVCAFWEDAETRNVMMSLFWYYRPEHTEEGRKPHHLMDEIFASRHRDVDSVECIEDKCYVLTFNEYCRYRKRCKMEQVGTTWSLTDVTIPVSNESYPRRNRIPDSDVNSELVFCCRQIYDSRMKRLVKNPLINPKYGHI